MVILEHLGKLHPFEHVLVLVLAFGPFLVLGLVVWSRQRRLPDQRDGAADPTSQTDQMGQTDRAGQADHTQWSQPSSVSH